MDENISEMITPDALQECPAEQVPLEEPISTPEQNIEEPVLVPQAPEFVPAQSQEVPAPSKPGKKRNKKVLLIAIAAVVVIALAIGLVSLLGGSTKNTGVFIRDGELYLYADGMKEPVELTSRLWKGADGNSDLVGMSSRFITLVTIRNNGQLVFYPDKFDTDADGYTIFVKNMDKPKEDPVKIGSDISWYDVTEDGRQMLYAKYDGSSYTLYLYDVKKDEEIRLAKDVSHPSYVSYAEDLSTICYRSDKDLYCWTPKTEDVKVAKDVHIFRYMPETGMLIALNYDGELVMKTADMEKCEEVADGVATLLAAYPTGEAYFLRQTRTERRLLDYLEDDMAAEDAAISQPTKPNYPSAPKKVYYWSYATDAEYQAAKAQYELDYAAYLEQYNAMKDAYNNALALYKLKQERDAVREALETRVLEQDESSLYYFDGSEEHLLADALVSDSFMAQAADVPVLVYNAYTPTDLVKPRMSEIEDPWSAASLVQQAIKDALYTGNEFYLLQGGTATVIDQTAASNFIVAGDGSAVYFLDAPFVAYSNKNAAFADAPAAEAPAAAVSDVEADEEKDEQLIPVNQREYASLYCITIAGGKAGSPEPVDSDVSIQFPLHIGRNASRLVYFKEVDGDDHCGELYVGGQLIHEEAFLNTRVFLEDSVLFYTDWDKEDGCGTLCMRKLGDENAEVIEIADDVYLFTVTENEDLFYLQDYSKKRCEGTLFLYDTSRGKATEIADDVVFLASHR